MSPDAPCPGSKVIFLRPLPVFHGFPHGGVKLTGWWCRAHGRFAVPRRRAAAGRQPLTLTPCCGICWRPMGGIRSSPSDFLDAVWPTWTEEKKNNLELEPLVEGSHQTGLHSSCPGKARTLNSPKWLSHFNSNTRFSFSKVLIQLDLDLSGWVICLKGIISYLLTVVISLLRWLKHLFSAIFSPATHPTPTN